MNNISEKPIGETCSARGAEYLREYFEKIRNTSKDSITPQISFLLKGVSGRIKSCLMEYRQTKLLHSESFECLYLGGKELPYLTVVAGYIFSQLLASKDVSQEAIHRSVRTLISFVFPYHKTSPEVESVSKEDIGVWRDYINSNTSDYCQIFDLVRDFDFEACGKVAKDGNTLKRHFFLSLIEEIYNSSNKEAFPKNDPRYISDGEKDTEVLDDNDLCENSDLMRKIESLYNSHLLQEQTRRQAFEEGSEEALDDLCSHGVFIHPIDEHMMTGPDVEVVVVKNPQEAENLLAFAHLLKGEKAKKYFSNIDVGRNTHPSVHETLRELQRGNLLDETAVIEALSIDRSQALKSRVPQVGRSLMLNTAYSLYRQGIIRVFTDILLAPACNMASETAAENFGFVCIGSKEEYYDLHDVNYLWSIFWWRKYTDTVLTLQRRNLSSHVEVSDFSKVLFA